MTSIGALRKSKKQSASNSTSTPPDDLVFFIDECLGTAKVPDALTAAGAKVKILSDVFPAGTKDTTWLNALAKYDWVVLTKDKNIRRHPQETQAFIDANLRVFVVTATDLTGDETGAVIVKALPKIRRVCKKLKPPFIAGITRLSQVMLLAVKPKTP